ncbi:MAG TPA: DUF1223 domain-containing protein [Flavisolibacter sp.]|jgi:hypothetical protein|nr:DUF1223 domain-containing protein [Flavisolibacter sp.]
MKLVILLAVAGLSVWAVRNHESDKNPAQKTSDFAVLELFTSEGCSSCPSADALLESVNKDYSGKNVLVLSYHVDYWDRLGWKDRFSSAANTRRQNSYAEHFRLNSIYTPQVVINGKSEFVGSDRSRLQSALKDVGDKGERLQLRAKEENGKIAVSIPGSPKQTSTLIVLVQKQASTQVKGGENKSRFLKHVNIVSSFENIGNKKEAVISFTGLNKSDYFMVALLQDDNTGEIKNYGRTEIL